MPYLVAGDFLIIVIVTINVSSITAKYSNKLDFKLFEGKFIVS